MRDALLITFILIFLFVLIGVMYNLLNPYLVKLGLREEGAGGVELKNDGGIFRSLDFTHSWSHVVDISDVGNGDDDFAKSNIFDLQFDAKDSNSLYVATSFGLYTSQDLGDQWLRMGDGLLESAHVVQSFAQDSKNTQRKYLALHDGERGLVLKSRGSDFYEVYSTSIDKDKVLGVWVDPFDSATIYASTEAGLFLESKDFGESWKIKKEFPDAVRDLEVLSSDTRIIYAVVGAGRLFKSSDRGVSWNDISSQFKNYGASFTINDFAIDPRNEKRLYIASNVGFLKSENGGATFSKVSLLVTGDSTDVSAVGVDSQNSNIIYIGINNQIHKTDDGGKKWQIKTLDTDRKISVIRVKQDDSMVIFVGVKQ